MNGGALTWRSSKQETIVDLTTELNYIATNEASKEAMLLKNFINNLGVVPSKVELVKILCDNEGMDALTIEPRDHKRTRHNKRKFHLIIKLVEYRDIIVIRVPSEDNPTDPLTKPLSHIKHDAHTRSDGT